MDINPTMHLRPFSYNLVARVEMEPRSCLPDNMNHLYTLRGKPSWS